MAGDLHPGQAAAIRTAFRKRYDLRGTPRYQTAPAAQDAARRAPSMSAPSMSSLSRPSLVKLPRPAFAVRVLNNLSFGATAASIAEFNALGSDDTTRLTRYVDAQLAWNTFMSPVVCPVTGRPAVIAAAL